MEFGGEEARAVTWLIEGLDFLPRVSDKCFFPPVLLEVRICVFFLEFLISFFFFFPPVYWGEWIFVSRVSKTVFFLCFFG